MSHKLSKEQLDSIFKDIAKDFKKRIKNKALSYELIIVGGASILLNYSFRETTVDIDCLDIQDALMNEIINNVGEKYQLPHGWINTDFIKTNSYTPKLIQYSTYYKSYANGSLIIRTIKDEYLIAMKMMAARKYKHDYSDIFGIIKENPSLSFEKVIKAVENLYGDASKISSEMTTFVKSLFEPNSISYAELEKGEKETEAILLTKYSRKNWHIILIMIIS